jgi:Flp pilus assembly pilin Flp
MEFATRMFVKAREWHKGLEKGQTMTEYALILAAVAVVVYITYKAMGNDITTLVNAIDTDLTAAA